MKLLSITILFFAGCASSEKVLSKTPDYFQRNIGEVKNEISPLGFIVKGYVKSDESGCPIHLYWGKTRTR